MNRIKEIVKEVMRFFIRIEIFFHGDKKNDSTAAISLNNRYQSLSYDLSQAVKSIDKHNYDLSIIVPVYNASKFINECIDSLIKQKTAYNYEIICVDDGSIDNSLELLKQYKDTKIKLIHQENGGISCARNTGLNVSTGKYVGFIDNDDYVKEDYVQKLLDSAYKNNADYVKCGYQVVDDETNKVIETKSFKESTLNDLNNVDNPSMWLHGYMWGGCYKRELWNGFCFPKGYWYEDMVKNMYLYSECKVLSNVEDILYIKRKHQNNAADVLWKKNNIKCLDQLFLAKELIQLRKNSNDLTYKATLMELGEYLYKRTMGLDEEIAQYAFCEASKLIEDRDISLSFELQKTKEALLNKDYQLWKLVGKYCRYR